MNFQFSEEQQLLADSVKRLVERDYEFEARKSVLHSDDGFSADVWAALGEMGVFGLALSEDSGGFGMGVLGMVPIMEQVGRGLLLEPLVPTLMCAKLIESLGGDEGAEVLEKLVQGELKMALAWQEAGQGDDVAGIAMQAQSADDGQYRLSGEKVMVSHAPMADKLLVCARLNGSANDAAGLSVFMVDAGASGMSMAAMRTVDGYRAADIHFENTPAICLGDPGGAFDAIENAMDFGNMLICAESIGAMEYANEATLEYIKSRKQFGVPIGAFQALQHRMVDMTVSAQQARSMVYLACDTFDRAASGDIDAKSRQHVISAAKIKIADAARQIGQESIQLHGGMGMTDEMKVSHTFKRLTIIGHQFGDVDYHLGRFAATDV